MEAILPISAAVGPAARADRGVGPTVPTVGLPLRFILAGLTSLIVGVTWLVTQPSLLTTYHYNQNIIALTHLVVLGWICSVVMGAMYQLVPVALETKLYSERLAKWQFAFHLVGFVGMVWMFETWNMKQVGHFGSVLAVGVGLFMYNLARTLLRVQKWNVVATAIASSVLAGLSIAAGKCAYDSSEGVAMVGGVRTLISGLRAAGTYMSCFDAISAMHAHAHLGVIGLFTTLIVGVSYKLVPLFTLSEVQNHRRANLSVGLLNLGLLGVFISVLLRSPWKFVFGLVICAALLIYGWEIAAIVMARKRATLDWGVRSFLTALGMLGPLAVLGSVLAWPRLPINVFTGQLENLYGFLGLLGFVTFAVIGMLHKIIPFLVWFQAYSPHVGHWQVPTLASLYSERLQKAGYWAWLAGLTTAGSGILMQSESVTRLGCLALASTLVLLAANVGRMLCHVLRPKLNPLAAGAK
jgi:hypothetical protein